MQVQAPVRTYMWSKSSAASEWRQNCFWLYGCECSESHHRIFPATSVLCSNLAIFKIAALKRIKRLHGSLALAIGKRLVINLLNQEFCHRRFFILMNIAYLCTGFAKIITAKIIKKTRSNEKRRKAFNADFGQDGILRGSQRTAAVTVIHDGSKNPCRKSPHSP